MAGFGCNWPVAIDTRMRKSAFVRFFESEASGSFLLLTAALVALAWANSTWSAEYFRLLNLRIGFAWNGTQFVLTFRHWINDGVMALFFFVVGLEIKREILAGELSSVKKATLPIVAALGGMAVPAAIYVAINNHNPAARGWGVPTTTDIAFAIGILALLGRSVPANLKVFL